LDTELSYFSWLTAQIVKYMNFKWSNTITCEYMSYFLSKHEHLEENWMCDYWIYTIDFQVEI